MHNTFNYTEANLQQHSINNKTASIKRYAVKVNNSLLIEFKLCSVTSKQQNSAKNAIWKRFETFSLFACGSTACFILTSDGYFYYAGSATLNAMLKTQAVTSAELVTQAQQQAATSAQTQEELAAIAAQVDEQRAASIRANAIDVSASVSKRNVQIVKNAHSTRTQTEEQAKQQASKLAQLVNS